MQADQRQPDRIRPRIKLQQKLVLNHVLVTLAAILLAKGMSLAKNCGSIHAQAA